jgi:predicted MFS family arabinose efflux permease
VVGPLLGGGLSQSLGWRSTFAALAIAGGAVLALQLAVMKVRRAPAIGCPLGSSPGRAGVTSCCLCGGRMVMAGPADFQHELPRC